MYGNNDGMRRSPAQTPLSILLTTGAVTRDYIPYKDRALCFSSTFDYQN